MSKYAIINPKDIYIGGIKMDRITKGFLDEFSISHGFSSLKEDLQFEHFANFCALSSEINDIDIDIQEMSTGDSAQGIDGIAIQVNGTIVSSIDEIKSLITQNRRLDVKFIFVQAKTSEKFDNLEIGNFLTFVETFFSDAATSVFNTEEMQKFIELKDCIYDNSKYMKSSNPEIMLFHVTLGKWNETDVNLNATINARIASLKASNLFSKVAFTACDAPKIQDLYRKSQQQLSATFTFSKNLMMFTDENSDYGYIGVLPFSEFKKIICDESESLKKVFEDNIRDFLGEKNSVNEDIENTICDGGNSSFCMLNNGITVVAHSAILVSDKMTIEDYQIVNGCQTSHVLYLNRNNEKINSLLIPIKIIITKNEDLKNRITKATNNQTSITKEQLEALSSYQKTLEEYFKTFEDDERLFYERRAGQYRNEAIPKYKIISIRSQIKNASAMFSEKPHDAAGHYSMLMKDIGTKIFKKDDKPSLYYISSLAMFRFENLIKTRQIDKKFSKSKYHAIMLLKYMFGNDIPKYYNSKKMDTFCGKIQKVLNDPTKCLAYFKKIIEFIESQAELDIDERKLFERKETTAILLSHINDLKTP